MSVKMIVSRITVKMYRVKHGMMLNIGNALVNCHSNERSVYNGKTATNLGFKGQ